MSEELPEKPIITYEELKELLTLIISNDKTPTYGYAERKGREAQYFNNEGEAPETGSRWATPREIAEGALRRLWGK